MRFGLICIFLFTTYSVLAQNKKTNKAILVEDKPWTEARNILHDTTIVVIPLGAESKEHGPHLLLKNDWLIAEYLKNRIAKDD